MQLVKSRPISLPVEQMGWWDDFAVSGFKNNKYSSSGTITKNAWGISLSSAGAMFSPPFTAQNFALETIVRGVAGSFSFEIDFRYVNSNNEWRLKLDAGTGVLSLNKIVSGVNTAIGTVSGLSTNKWYRVNIRAIGPVIEVFLDGTRVFNVISTDLLTNTRFRFNAWDSSACQSDWQYVAIQQL